MRRALRRVITLLILAGLGYGFYWFGNIFLWPPPDRSTIRAVGMVEAPEVNITSRIAGRITDLKLLEGDRVTRGQVICRIEDIDIRNQLRKAEADLLQAQANMMNAKRTLDRDERLYAQKVIAVKDRDDAQTAYDQAVASVASNKANVDFFKDQLTDTAIVSPVDGVVVNKALEVGEWVTPGTPDPHRRRSDHHLGARRRAGNRPRIDLRRQGRHCRASDRPAGDFQWTRDGDRAGRKLRDRARRAAWTAGHPHLLRQGAGAAGRWRIETRDDSGSIVRAASRWNPTSAAITTKDLCKRFGSFTAVKGVTLEVERGEVFGLLGPNGAGKTTLVRMLTTLLPPTSGEARVAGEDIARYPTRVRKKIGVIPQAMTSDLDLTGWENIDIYGEFYGMPRRQRRERAERLLDMVGIRDRAQDLVATYSGGMRRRLEIARGLIHSPEVLFLDEPTIGLDPQSRLAVHDLLVKLRQESELTISLTTHYMDEAESLCDRIAIVDHGTVVALDTPQGLKASIKGSDRIELEVKGPIDQIVAMLSERPEIHDVKREGADGKLTIRASDGAHALPNLISQIDAINGEVTSINLHRISLEDVFIELTGRSLRDEPAQKVSLLVGAGMPQRR